MTSKTTPSRSRTRDQISARALDITSPSRRRKQAAVAAAQAPEENKPEPVAAPAEVAAEVVQPVSTGEPASARSRETKSDQVVQQLRTESGATIAEIMAATGWQAHSVRGFFSAVVRKKLGLDLVSSVGEDGMRRYRIDTVVAA
ncbi:MAG: hypothetical protein K0S00_4351 [Xanthobacteraceae bacterium]|jgi:hypothetical protein|nr:hypothetical protein [Xanthobacteraceae bacterium]